MTMLFCLFTLLMLALVIHSLWLQNSKLAALRESLNLLSKNLAESVRDHTALVRADLIFASQLQDINRQLTGMDNQVQGLANQRDNDGGYQHALRILQMGGDREEIISSCHLSAAEADLLMNLHAYSSAIASNKS